MSKITQLLLQTEQKALTIKDNEGNSTTLRYEYLRVYPALAQGNAKPAANKKDVLIYNIEHVGKHGFRFIFNDEYSCLITADYLLELIEDYDKNWQTYLDSLANNKMSREAKIDILNLS